MDELLGDDCFRILDNPEYILFYFTAPWCVPCQKITPYFIQLMNTYDSSKILFYKIDIDKDENDEISNKCLVESVPSFLLFKDRNYKERVSGANLKKIKQMIDKYV